MNALQDIINRNRVSFCLDCGKCSAVCPITRWEAKSFASPRLLVEKAFEGQTRDIMETPLFWSCLTCKQCSELCPSAVYFSEFIRDVRSLAQQKGHSGPCAHGEVIQTWARMMTDPDLHQNRLGWLCGDLKTSDDSDTIFFVGCLPYYDTLFQHLDIEGIEIARAAVRILNHLGIEPQVMANERCCGHDQLWEGDMKTFKALAKLNLEEFTAAGAKRIITACPECVRTIGLDYPRLVGTHGMEVFHISQFLTEQMEDRKLEAIAQRPERTATFQDPCRLGRHLGIYDAPRKLIAGLGLKLIEMDRRRNTSLCCGTSCWTSCGQVSKNIQVERLKEAKATTADLLITACIKCQIHFKCAQADPVLKEDISIEIRDLTTLIAEQLVDKTDRIEPFEETHAARLDAN